MSFWPKYQILALIAGVLFVVTLMVSAPIVLGVLHWLTAASAPSEAEVCNHFTAISLEIPDCEGYLVRGRPAFGDYNDNVLRCYAAAKNGTEAVACEDPVSYMSDTWAK